MPTVRIALVGSFNPRSIDGSATLAVPEDQRFLNCNFDVVRNPVTGKATVYVEKRPGWGQDSLVSSGIASTGLVKPQAFNAAMSAFGAVSSNVYVGTINVGVLSARALHFTETLVSATSHVLIRASDGSAWYYVDGAKDQLSYTGHTSSGSATVSTIATTLGLYPGQLITGGQIGAAARVSTVNFATSTITLTVTSSATSTGAVLTKEPIARVLSTVFVSTGTYISAIVPIDGYHIYATDDGYLRNSDLNSVTAYTTNNNIAVQQSPDPSVAVAVIKNNALVLGLASKEVFQNASLASGSPFQRVPQVFDRVGCIDQRSLTTFENEIYFAATPYEGDVGIYRIRDLQAQRISTPAIDRILGTISATNGAIYASSYRLGGYAYASFYCSLATDGPASDLLLESGDFVLLEDGDNILLEDTPAQTASFVRRLVYNINLNIWSEADDNQATFIDSVGGGTANQLLATSRVNTGGKIYKIDPIAAGVLYQDDGTTISTQIRTSRIDHGTNDVKIIDEIKLICDKESTGVVTLEASDDDYDTWQTLGDFDLTKMGPHLTRCGSFHGGRAYRLTHSSNAHFRAEALEIKYRLGRS